MPTEWCRAGLSTIDGQLLHLYRRHRRIQQAVLIIYSGILSFLSSMIVIAIAKMLNAFETALIALILFLLGTGLFVVGVILATLEVQVSHQAVHSEMKWVMTLTKPQLPN